MKRHFMLSFLFSIILACIVISVGACLYSRETMASVFRLNLDTTTRQIGIILRQYDKIFNAFQVELNREGRIAIRKIYEELKDPYRRYTPEQLGEIVRKYGVDEIYFINKNGVVFNTSFLPEMNLDLFKTSVFYENYLRSIYGTGNVFTPQASMGINSGAINKYIYFSPAQSDVIIAVSYNLKNYISRKYSANYYDFMSLKKMVELTGGNSFLKDIDVISVSAGNNFWSLLNIGRKINIPARLAGQIMDNGQVIISQGDKVIVYSNVSAQNEVLDIYDSSLTTMPRILMLTYDVSLQNRYMKNLILFTVLIMVVSCVCCFVGFSWYFNRKYFSRLLSINAGLDAIANGNYDVKVPSSGHDEIGIMGRNINRMTEEIRNRENELRRSEKRFRSIFEYAPVGIVILNLNRQLRYYNQAFMNISGYSADELVNRDYLQLVAPDEAPKAIKVINRIARGMIDSNTTDRRMVAKDGSVILAAVTAALIKDESNKPAYMMLMVNDITERRQIEQQLLQVQKLDAVGKLAGGVAHDFNNLLQVILGYKSMIAKHLKDNPQGLELWGNIMTAADRAKTLARQLLAFGRFKPSADRKLLDPNTVTQGFMKMLQRVLGEDIDIQFSPEGNVPKIYADEAQMEQVLMNLCVNARDAMPNGGVLKLMVRLVYVDEAKALQSGAPKPGHYVRCSVVDAGTGMSEDIRKQIFQPFFTTKEVGKGTGLGLATVLEIIRAHNGFVEVDSTVGQGTTVHCYLPPAETLEESIPLPVEEEGNMVETHVTGRGEVILMCEDEIQVRELATLMLTEAGYQVLTAEDGEKAEIMYERNKEQIDLILLDVIMPKKSGRQVFKYIRDTGSKLPILFTTGYSNEMLGGEFGENVIQKPYTEEELLKRVREILDRKS